MPRWSVEYYGDRFERFVRTLPEYEQAVLFAAVENVLQVHGIDICSGEWGKPLGGGLFEFRIRMPLHRILAAAGDDRMRDSSREHSVLLRVFCTFHGSKVIVLFHGYDKKRDPSSKRQQREIARARALHERWKRQRRA